MDQVGGNQTLLRMVNGEHTSVYERNYNLLRYLHSNKADGLVASMVAWNHMNEVVIY